MGGMGLGMDPVYWMMLLPCIVFAGIASLMVKTTFGKFSKVRSSLRYTGAQAAKRMLERNGVTDVKIEEVQGFLTDHYDPSCKTLRLSPDVYAGDSLSSIGVACHEAGHALQHANGYAPLKMRSAMVPVTNIASRFSIWVILAGIALQLKPLLLVGCALFGVAFLFSVVTLPVEWNASARAKVKMVEAGVVSQDEAADAGKVLNAAFLTYVAAAMSSLMTLLYYLMRSGLLNGGRGSRD